MQTEQNGQGRHAMLPQTTAEEFSRQEFVKSLKLHLATRVSPGNRDAYEARARPAFAKAQGRAPESHGEIRKAMADEPYFTFWSAMLRNSQEMMWKAVQIPVERQLPELLAASAAADGPGSLRLNPEAAGCQADHRRRCRFPAGS